MEPTLMNELMDLLCQLGAGRGGDELELTALALVSWFNERAGVSLPTAPPALDEHTWALTHNTGALAATPYVVTVYRRRGDERKPGSEVFSGPSLSDAFAQAAAWADALDAGLGQLPPTDAETEWDGSEAGDPYLRGVLDRALDKLEADNPALDDACRCGHTFGYHCTPEFPNGGYCAASDTASPGYGCSCKDFSAAEGSLPTAAADWCNWHHVAQKLAKALRPRLQQGDRHSVAAQALIEYDALDAAERHYDAVGASVAVPAPPAQDAEK